PWGVGAPGDRGRGRRRHVEVPATAVTLGCGAVAAREEWFLHATLLQSAGPGRLRECSRAQRSPAEDDYGTLVFLSRLGRGLDPHQGRGPRAGLRAAHHRAAGDDALRLPTRLDRGGR